MELLILVLVIEAALALSATFMIRLYQSFHRFTLPLSKSKTEKLPSVSICIPARNETHAMAQCLERVLASDYQKLEIVVFDDDSGDDTSRIIRSFAQAGVRFVAGTGLPNGWLGKNYALDVLSKEASGKYVVFMDVDTIIGPQLIGQLVNAMEEKQLSMVSVIPSRPDGWRASVLFGHLRYFWELAVSTNQHPPAASALWMVNRQTLIEDMGGMETFKLMAIPESAIAARLGYDAYNYFVAGHQLDISYEKKWSSQIETSKRLLFPRAGGNGFGAVLALSSLVILNAPTVILLSGAVTGWSGIHTAAAVTMVAAIAVYGMYTYTMWHRAWWAGALMWPIVVLQELVLFILSVWAYGTHRVTWKGRPVTPNPRITPVRVKS